MSSSSKRSKRDRSSKSLWSFQNLIWLLLLVVFGWILYTIFLLNGDKPSFLTDSLKSSGKSAANVLREVSQVVTVTSSPDLAIKTDKSAVETSQDTTAAPKLPKLPTGATALLRTDAELDFEATENQSITVASMLEADTNSRVVVHTRVQQRTLEQLRGHYMNRLGLDQVALKYPHNGLDQLMLTLQNQPQCRDVPVFVAMAAVVNELYWQLVENFIYTMTHFDLSDCAIMICVSDEGCMRRCRDSLFPCFLYHYEDVYGENKLEMEYKRQHQWEKQRSVSTLEQIANLKLYYLPKALALGVYLFVLDLDVGWIHNPMELVRYHLEHKPNVDILVQYDWGFEMDRSVEKWKTWYVQPIVNIGVFLCRGNERTAHMFEMAWNEYKTDCLIKIRGQPGKDQNKVLGAMGRARNGKIGLRWEYFPNASAVLIDKIQKFHTNLVELGGEVSESLLSTELIKHYPASIILKGKGRGLNNGESGLIGNTGSSVRAVAAHTTCYEKATKVTGLKAVSAFWNPFYYDPTRPTLTKQLVYTTPAELISELQTLVYIAIVTRRALIIPNLIGDPNIPTLRPRFKTSFNYFDLWDNHLLATTARRRSNSAGNQFHYSGRMRNGHTEDVSKSDPLHNWIALWPGFRVLYTSPATATKSSYLRWLFDSLEVLEATFYWRMTTHYDIAAPEPTIRVYDTKDLDPLAAGGRTAGMNSESATRYHGKGVDTIINDIRSLDRSAHPRVVIHVVDSSAVSVSGEEGVQTKVTHVTKKDRYIAASIGRAAVIPLVPSDDEDAQSWTEKSSDGAIVRKAASVSVQSSSPAILSVVSKLIYWLNDSVGATWDYNSHSNSPDGFSDLEGSEDWQVHYYPMSYTNLRQHYQPLPSLLTRRHAYNSHFAVNYLNILNKSDISTTSSSSIASNAEIQELTQLYETMQFQTKNIIRSCAHIWRISSNRSCFDKCK